MKFGITQGRLTNERKGVLQKFPKNWEKEFAFLTQTGLDYIELFLENKINENNPIWSETGQKKLLKIINKTNIKHHIVCDNYILNKSLRNSDLIEYYKKLFKSVKAIKCKLLIIPIDNKNFLSKNLPKFVDFIFFLKQESKKNKVMISLEINENYERFNKILLSNNIKDIKITFDTGNFYLTNKNVLKNLKKYLHLINHIHLKDRNTLGVNVVFGSGIINFKNLFIFLKKKKYNKYFTFETNRGTDALKTATNNLKITKNLI